MAYLEALYEYADILNEEVKITDKLSAYQGYKCTNKSIEGIPVSLMFDKDENHLKDLEDSFKTFNKNYKKCINEKLIPWLDASKYGVKDDDIKKALKIVEVTYHYQHYVANTSPTGKDDYINQYELMIKPKNETAKKVFEAVAIEICIKDNKVVQINCYDI